MQSKCQILLTLLWITFTLVSIKFLISQVILFSCIMSIKSRQVVLKVAFPFKHLSRLNTSCMYFAHAWSMYFADA